MALRRFIGFPSLMFVSGLFESSLINTKDTVRHIIEKIAKGIATYINNALLNM